MFLIPIIMILIILILLQRWTNYWLRVTAIESAHMSRQVRVMMKTKTLVVGKNSDQDDGHDCHHKMIIILSSLV